MLSFDFNKVKILDHLQTFRMEILLIIKVILLSKNEYKDKMALLFQGGVFTLANFKGNIKKIK
jgi:hypothetical protein